jgi:hypothetical protein
MEMNDSRRSGNEAERSSMGNVRTVRVGKVSRAVGLVSVRERCHS